MLKHESVIFGELFWHQQLKCHIVNFSRFKSKTRSLLLHNISFEGVNLVIHHDDVQVYKMLYNPVKVLCN